MGRTFGAAALLLSACAAGNAMDAGGMTPDDGVADVDAALPVDAGADAGVDATAGPSDAGAPDAGANDAGSDAGGMDAGTDAGGTDAGGTDAGTAVALDASGGGTVVKLECVPATPGNETASGMVLSDAFWPGFRFQVPAGPDVTAGSIGLNVRSSGAGTIFGALVRLTSMTDVPDAPDLTGADVLATTSIALPGGASSVTVTGPITATLPPGWYAAVFGTGAFGATLASATVHSNSGSGGCTSGFGFPFSIRQSDGMLILQAATPHFVVEGTR